MRKVQRISFSERTSRTLPLVSSNCTIIANHECYGDIVYHEPDNNDQQHYVDIQYKGDDYFPACTFRCFDFDTIVFESDPKGEIK